MVEKSIVTVQRAIDELRSSGLLSVGRTGSSSNYSFNIGTSDTSDDSSVIHLVSSFREFIGEDFPYVQ